MVYNFTKKKHSLQNKNSLFDQQSPNHHLVEAANPTLYLVDTLNVSESAATVGEPKNYCKNASFKNLPTTQRSKKKLKKKLFI